MTKHVRILGILHIVFGGIGLLLGVLGLLFFGGLAAFIGVSDPNEGAFVAAPMLGIIATMIFSFAVLLSLPGIIVGVGLLNVRPWARVGGIVLSAIELLHVPFGTALGVYGLWILLSNETERLFATGAHAMPVLR
jgi:hypothetical protein